MATTVSSTRGSGLLHLTGRSTTAREAVPHAKLTPPRLRHRTVRRERLLEWLDSAVASCRLTVVSGPPGAGKTTLLASWVATGRAPARLGWVSLDAHDDSPSTFWSAVAASFAQCPALAGGRLDAAHAPRETPTLLAEALPEDDDPTVLILDDLQDVRDPAVLEGLRTLLRSSPPSLRVVISTRHDPPLQLPRLRVAGQLAETRAAALAFTAEEARELMIGHGLTLPLSEIETLVQRTEGWAGALALAAIALQGSSEPALQIGRIAGDDRAVADYLASEMLDELPADARDLLIRTAIVDRISGPLADAITGFSNGAEALEELERRNCFVVALDRKRHWYRYHCLLLELLRSRLSGLSRAERRELDGRAAAWLSENGSGAEAIEHAIRAEHWELACELISAHWLDAFLSGRSAALRPLLDGLPSAFAERDAGVALALSAVHLDVGDHSEADRYLELGRGLAYDGTFAEQIAIVRLLRARSRGDLETALQIAADLVAARPGPVVAEEQVDEPPALVQLLIGGTEVWADRRPAAAHRLRNAVAQSRYGDLEYLSLGALGYLAVIEVVDGRLGSGSELAREALALAEQHGWLDSPHVASAMLALGWAQLLVCDPAASATLDGALSAAHRSSDAPLQQAIAAIRALASLDNEGARRGLDILATARSASGRRTWPPLVDRLLRSIEIRLLLALGEDRQVVDRLGRMPHSARAAVLRARYALAHADPATALAQLAPFVAQESPDSDVTARVEALVLDAVARHRQLDKSGAAASLERALDLADADRSIWAFLQAGPSLRTLLTFQLRNGTAHRGLVEALLARVEQLEASGGSSAEPLMEQLSPRERALLSYLETMLSTEEIASELFVSANTVKSHTKSIYRKLGVTRRRQAVVRARALRLL
jgi:LuxR family maltose regulon positive regulatory protein